MSVKNIGTNRWRVKAKTGVDPKTGKTLYFDSTIKGTHEDAKRLEAEHTLYDKRMFSDLKLQMWMETKWLPMIKEDCAGNTYDYYEGASRRHIFPYIGHVPLRDLDTPLIKAYLQQVSDSGKTPARKTLSAALSCATEDGLIPINPISLLSRHTKAKKKKGRPFKGYRTFSAAECIEFQKAIYGTSIEAVCLIMLNAGARREEACALDWEQFDWDSMTVPVERGYVVRGCGCEMKDPKNDESWRDLYLKGYAADRLYELSIGQSGPIAKNPKGTRMRPDRANQLFHSICELYGLPMDVSLMHLRHTFATQHLQAGTDVATLKKLMGHSSISTIIDRYLIPLESAQSSAQDLLAARLDPRTDKAWFCNS